MRTFLNQRSVVGGSDPSDGISKSDGTRRVTQVLSERAVGGESELSTYEAPSLDLEKTFNLENDTAQGCECLISEFKATVERCD